MKNSGLLTKIMAIAGTVLILVPVAAAIVFALTKLFRSGVFLFDYLLPAEFFPVAIAGGLLLAWAAFRARTLRKLIIWSFAAMVSLLAASQGFAVISGLASGKIAAEGLPLAITFTLIILYSLSTIVLGAAGIALDRRLFKGRD